LANQSGSPIVIKPSDVHQFEWVNLADDGKLELAVVSSPSPGPCCAALNIYWQDAPGNIREEGYGNAGNLKEVIRDLNGDRKKELVLYAYLDSDSYRGGIHPTGMYPKVYSLKDNKYVEASRDFPEFYDSEVLPDLEKKVKDLRAWIAKPPPSNPARPHALPYAGLAAAEMERDKILRMLGRNPTAGLDLARQWVHSDNPDVIEDAAVVFRDIGGYEDEARAADAAFKRAFAAQRAEQRMRGSS
jgi:hypothetical protein